MSKCCLWSRFSFGEAVTVYVGPEVQPFTLHKSLLAAESEYFEAALKKEWPEGRIGKMSSPTRGSNFFRSLLSGRAMDRSTSTSFKGPRMLRRMRAKMKTKMNASPQSTQQTWRTVAEVTRMRRLATGVTQGTPPEPGGLSGTMHWYKPISLETFYRQPASTIQS